MKSTRSASNISPKNKCPLPDSSGHFRTQMRCQCGLRRTLTNRQGRARGKLACMRKRLITPSPETIRSRGEGWLDVERAAIVEFTSEDNDYPVESAFVSGQARGWRAVAPGSQTIR